jgi:hypothetical protein
MMLAPSSIKSTKMPIKFEKQITSDKNLSNTNKIIKKKIIIKDKDSSNNIASNTNDLKKVPRPFFHKMDTKVIS